MTTVEKTITDRAFQYGSPYIHRIGLVLAVASALSVSSAHAEFEAVTAPSDYAADPTQNHVMSFNGMPLTLNLKVRGFTGFDSNVPFIAERPPFFGTGSGDANQSSAYVGASLEGAVRLRVGLRTRVGVGMRADQTFYIDDQKAGAAAAGANSPQDYNLTVLNPAIFVERDLQVAGKPAQIKAQFDYRNERADVQAVGVDVYRLSAKGRVAVAPRVIAGIDYEHSWIESRAFPDANSVQSRDGQVDKVTGSVSYEFPDRRRRVTLSGGYANYNAQGSFFDHDGYHTALDYVAHLGGRLYTELGAFAEFRNYDPNVAGRNRENIRGVKAKLLYYVNRNVTLDVYYTFEDIQGNGPTGGGLDPFSGDRHNAGIGITFTP